MKLALILLVLPGLALAQERASPRRGGAEVTTIPPRILIPRRDCRALAVQRPDLDPNYRPGVDVQGNPVAPADAPSYGSPSATFTGPIVLDLRRAVPGLGGNVGASELTVGTVTVDPTTGQARLNGNDLTPDARDAIVGACIEARELPAPGRR